VFGVLLYFGHVDLVWSLTNLVNNLDILIMLIEYGWLVELELLSSWRDWNCFLVGVNGNRNSILKIRGGLL